MSYPSQSPIFNHPDYIMWMVQTTKFLIMKSSPLKLITLVENVKYFTYLYCFPFWRTPTEKHILVKQLHSDRPLVTSLCTSATFLRMSDKSLRCWASRSSASWTSWYKRCSSDTHFSSVTVSTSIWRKSDVTLVKLSSTSYLEGNNTARYYIYLT